MNRSTLLLVALCVACGERKKPPVPPADTTVVVDTTTPAPDSVLPDTGANTSAEEPDTVAAVPDTAQPAAEPEAAKKPKPAPAPTPARSRGVGVSNLPADSTCGPTYNATWLIGSGSMGATLEKVARCNGHVVISVGRRPSLDASGLSARMACANISTWLELEPFRKIVDASLAADDINNDFNGAGAPRYATIDSISRCLHNRWAWLPVYVRQRPSGLATSYKWRWLDGAWAQYDGPLHGSGSPTQYVDREEAAAKARGLGVIFGMNQLDAGDGSSKIMGTYLTKRDNRWQVTPAELLRADTLFVKHSCVVLSWTYGPGFNYSRPAAQLAAIKKFDTRSDVRDAYRRIMAVAARYPAILCPSRAARATVDTLTVH